MNVVLIVNELEDNSPEMESRMTKGKITQIIRLISNSMMARKIRLSHVTVRFSNNSCPSPRYEIS